LIFHARALLLKAQLEPCSPPTQGALKVLDALRTEVEVMVEECGRWPEKVPTDVTERLAATAGMYQRLRDLEEQVKVFLEGGR